MPTILIVEDEFAIAELLEMALGDAGYAVVSAANGRVAMERLAAGLRPDLILTDFMMPELNGAGLIGALRQDPTLARIPCVVMSSVPEEAVRMRTDGYRAFLRKPLQLATLVRMIAVIVPPGERSANDGSGASATEATSAGSPPALPDSPADRSTQARRALDPDSAPAPDGDVS
jgi:CheY-like chemotaxis protein